LDRVRVLAIGTIFPRGLCTVVVALLLFSCEVEEGIAQDTVLGIVTIAIIASTTLKDRRCFHDLTAVGQGWEGTTDDMQAAAHYAEEIERVVRNREKVFMTLFNKNIYIILLLLIYISFNALFGFKG
jgi:hypothetical protein